jgi:hypothetical protein
VCCCTMLLSFPGSRVDDAPRTGFGPQANFVAHRATCGMRQNPRFRLRRARIGWPGYAAPQRVWDWRPRQSVEVASDRETPPPRFLRASSPRSGSTHRQGRRPPTPRASQMAQRGRSTPPRPGSWLRHMQRLKRTVRLPVISSPAVGTRRIARRTPATRRPAAAGRRRTRD